MPSTADERLDWPAGIRIRPAARRGTTAVEVTDTITGRRFKWNPDALAAHLLQQGEPSGDGDKWREAIGTGADRAHILDGWRHWLEREWQPSDTYYLASRRFQYADVDDPDSAIRAKTLEAYLENGGGPVDEVLPEGRIQELGAPMPLPDRRLAEVLFKRRTGRAFVPRDVPLDRLSGLLWHALANVRARREQTTADRPLSYLESFGTAWDFYVCVYAVEGVEPGVYRYDVLGHRLIEVRPGDHRETMVDILQGMASPRSASWTLGLVADFPRYQWRYRHEHGLRRLYLESGIIVQEIIVLAESYGLSSLMSPAQKDGPYLELHGLDRDRYAPVYTVTTGPKRGRGGFSFGPDFEVPEPTS